MNNLSAVRPDRPPAAPGADLASVRWLGSLVLARSVAARPLDVPVPWLVSACLKRSRRAASRKSAGANAVRDYVLWWIAHPAAGSRFAARTRLLRRLPGGLLLRVMLALGYDGIVYPKGDTILGHVFFQRRGREVHGFSTAVGDEFDGKGHSVVMMLDYLAYAAQLRGVVRARAGRGQNTVTRRLLERIKTHEDRLGWRVDADGWVTFAPASE